MIVTMNDQKLWWRILYPILNIGFPILIVNAIFSVIIYVREPFSFKAFIVASWVVILIIRMLFTVLFVSGCIKGFRARRRYNIVFPWYLYEGDEI